MKSQILRTLRRIIGTQQLSQQIDNLQKTISANTVNNGTDRLPNSNSALKILPGCEYAKYAIPVDYLPSRAFSPRYGFSHPKIEILAQWFDSYRESYMQFLEHMRTLDVTHIPVSLQTADRLKAAWIGGPIAAFDSLALYAMVQKYKPKTYLEIGSGMTTCFARQAAVDASLSTKVISIDPEPRCEIDQLCDQIIRDGLETYGMKIFSELEPGDILFFDGSHRAFMNSDVTVFFIDVLPRIRPGVIIHIHDILLPWDYADSFKYWYWNEQYMLAVYLMAAQEKLEPLLPTTWICQSPAFEKFFAKPFVDLGSQDANASWRGGGSMWFTKKS